MMKQRLKDNLVPLRPDSQDTAAPRLSPCVQAKFMFPASQLQCSVARAEAIPKPTGLHAEESVSEDCVTWKMLCFSGKSLSFVIPFLLFTWEHCSAKATSGGALLSLCVFSHFYEVNGGCSQDAHECYSVLNFISGLPGGAKR